MAVEARHLNLFPSQLITNRDFISTHEGIANIYNTQMDSALPLAQSMPESLLPFYQSVVCESVPAKTSMKADSGLTCNLPAPRKRTRDPMNQLDAFSVSRKNNLSELSLFLGEDVCFQIQQQQLEIDRFIAEHAQRVRLELLERRKRHSSLLAAAIEEAVTKKLKEKEEEIQRMGKLNWALQERVRSLCVENQLWRDLAQTNEATANSLRSNLEQVLAHVGEERLPAGGGGVAEDCVSSCGSSGYGREKRPRLEAEEEETKADKPVCGGACGGGNCTKRMCRKCGERESCVLLLPCRHLCLCTMCGSSLRICPVCNTNMTTSVHVNMS